jgi:uncharacterized protein (TIGR02145 family)
MKNILKILIIVVLTNCTDIPDDLLHEASLRDCDSVYDKATHFCYDGEVYALCGSIRYNPTTHICENGVANSAKCNGTQYNPLEKGCCGSKTFSLADQRCQSEVVETKCGVYWYDASDPWHVQCKNNIVEVECRSDYRWYDVNNANLRCGDYYVEGKCGTEWYAVRNQRCGANNVIETNCRNDRYDLNGWYDSTNTNLRCTSGNSDYVLETKCGADDWYAVADENLRCQNNVLETKCGAQWYNVASQCYVQCGIYYYDPTTQFCYNTFILNKCGNVEYDPSMQYCVDGIATTVKGKFTDTRNNKTYEYVTIGSQTWLADNLNYAVEGSKCYNNSEYNCGIYGRLYNWATAMNLPASCNNSTCSGRIQSKHKGICPEGWHIPSQTEWDVLSTYIGGSNTEGRRLKATNGWNSNNHGDDTYGFAALPGGNGWTDGRFSFVGDIGYWWSASEYGSDDAYARYMGYSSEDARWGYGSKDVLFSVRCLQD